MTKPEGPVEFDMDKVRGGTFAFPFCVAATAADQGAFCPGMTLRDWFASRAPEPPATWWGGGAKDCAGYALWGFQYADAMLAEREKAGEL
jgi:hypothetical protein